MNKKIIIGNWKMNPQNTKEAEKLFNDTTKSLYNIKKTEIIICPPYLYLDKLNKISLSSRAKKVKKVYLGAQNVFQGNTGAHTGEISVKMLYEMGIKYVILGHSERRNTEMGIGENNDSINQKIKSVFSFDMIPIFCVGENFRDEKHKYLEFIKTQLEQGLDKVPKNLISKLIVAYEPIWAIGKKAERPATSSEFLEIKIFIKKVLSDKFGIKNIEGLRVIYGGSIYEDDVSMFLKEGQVDGFLLGRNSLDVEKFTKIANIVENENS